HPGDQPVYEAAVRGPHQLQPDRPGQDDRVDPGSAADEPARLVGHAPAELLPGQAGPHALYLPAEPGAARRHAPTAEGVAWPRPGLGEEGAGTGPGGRGPGRRGPSEPYPLAPRPRLRNTLSHEHYWPEFSRSAAEVMSRWHAGNQPQGRGKSVWATTKRTSQQ